MENVRDDDKLTAYKHLADGFFKGGSESWPEAYYYYYLAMDEDRMQYIENRCNTEKKFVTQAMCYQRAGKTEKIRETANMLELAEGNKNAEIAAQCWELAQEWELAAKAWMRVFFRESELFEMLIGPNPKEGKINSPSLRRFFTHMEAQRASYGIDFEEWERLDYFANSDRDKLQKIAKIVSRVSRSDVWRKEFDERLAQLNESFKRVNFTGPAVENKIRRPEKTGIPTDDLVKYWDSLDTVLFQFWDKACDIAREAFELDNLLGVQIMAETCHRLQEAEQMVDKISSHRSGEKRQIYIQSWQYVHWSSDRISRELGQLYPLRDHEYIWEAIHTYFEKGSENYSAEVERFKKRLEGLKTSEKYELLSKYFPEYTPKEISKKPKHKEALADQPLPDLKDLIHELLDKSRYWDLNSDDMEELTERVQEILDSEGKNIRLRSKMKALQGLVPSRALEAEKTFFDQLDLAVQQSNRLVEDQLTAVNVPAPDNGQEVGLTESDAVDGNSGLKNGKHAEPDRKQPSRRRRRQSQNGPGILERINLHEMNQVDADNTLEAAIDKVSKDRKYGALLIIHGYGKDKEPSVIKENVRNRLKRFRGHARVKKVLYGENITRFSEDWNLALALCPELENADKFYENAGVTVVLLEGR